MFYETKKQSYSNEMTVLRFLILKYWITKQFSLFPTVQSNVPPVARPDPTVREKQQVYKAKKRYNHFLKSYHHQI